MVVYPHSVALQAIELPPLDALRLSELISTPPRSGVDIFNSKFNIFN